MKKNIFILILSLLYGSIFSQIELEWENKFNGTASFIDDGIDMIVDNEDNTYIIGKTFVNNPTNHYEIIVIKYNVNGIKQWQNTFSTNQTDDIPSRLFINNSLIYITHSSQGNLYLLTYNLDGQFESNMEIPINVGNHLTVNYSVKTQNNDLFVLTQYSDNFETSYFILKKFDLSINLIWTYTHETNANILKTKFDSSNNILLSGSTNYHYDGLLDKYIGDALLLKIDTNGNLIMNFSLDGIDNNKFINEFDLDENNNIYAIMSFKNILKIDYNGNLIFNNLVDIFESSTNLIYNIAYNNQNIYLSGTSFIPYHPNILTLSYYPNGNLNWHNINFTEPSFSASSTKINIDSYNNVYTSGYSHDVIGRHDIYLRYFTENGDILSDFSYNSTGNASESINKIVVKERNIYIFTDSDHDIMTQKLYNNLNTNSISDNEEEYKIYPIPFNNEFQIETNIQNKKELSIYNNLGEKVYHKEFINAVIKINPKFEKGVYLLKIVSENNQLYYKIIKN